MNCGAKQIPSPILISRANLDLIFSSSGIISLHLQMVHIQYCVQGSESSKVIGSLPTILLTSPHLMVILFAGPQIAW